MSIQFNFKSKKFEKIFSRLKDVHSEKFIQDVQSQVVEGQIKRLIRTGQSPVEGFGRFVQYKDKESYPLGQKPATPVNLFLSGNLMRFYVARVKSLKSIVLGIAPEADQKIKDRAVANNEGTLDLKGKKFNNAARTRIKERNAQPNLGDKKKKRSLQSVARANSGVPARRFIPLKGETFSVSVMRALKNLYAKRIRTLLSKD